MTSSKCECCGRNEQGESQRWLLPVKFVKARNGRMILCRSCWSGIRWMPAGFISPDPDIRRAADRYRSLAANLRQGK